jgi:hypothetical protein
MPRAKKPTTDKPAPTKTLPTDPTAFAREMYDQFWKQTEDKWGQLTRNPAFMSMMSTAVEQSQHLTGRIQDVVSTTLKAMNIPTRDDYKQLVKKFDRLSDQIDELISKIEERAESPAPEEKPAPAKKKPAARKSPARKTS